MTTMNEAYDDGSGQFHTKCDTCGFCIECGECSKFGCGCQVTEKKERVFVSQAEIDQFSAKVDKALSGSTVEIIKGKIPELRNLGDCLDEAKKTICGERQDTYGAPEDSFQLVAEYWSTYLRREYNSDHHHLKAKDIAHMMILFKMARVQGQKPSRDSYVDICGYSAIAADRLVDQK